MIIQLRRTDSSNADFKLLVPKLDADLLGRYREQQAFFDQFNSTEKIENVVIAYHNGSPVGCGAFKRFNENTVEIKRMFVEAEHRGKRIGRLVLNELESWARELDYNAAVLETAKKQPEAIKLYANTGYEVIPNYEPYVGVEISMCMKKVL